MKTWIYHYESEPKMQSNEMMPYKIFKTKNVQGTKVSWKNHATIFWDAQGVILVDFLIRGKTINSESYIETCCIMESNSMCQRTVIFFIALPLLFICIVQ